MPYLTKQELAAELKLPVTGIQALTRQRKIPVIRLGHRTPRYELEKVKAALARFEIQAVGDEGPGIPRPENSKSEIRNPKQF